jgi:hypothetical protein
MAAAGGGAGRELRWRGQHRSGRRWQGAPVARAAQIGAALAGSSGGGVAQIGAALAGTSGDGAAQIGARAGQHRSEKGRCRSGRRKDAWRREEPPPATVLAAQGAPAGHCLGGARRAASRRRPSVGLDRERDGGEMDLGAIDPCRSRPTCGARGWIFWAK